MVAMAWLDWRLMLIVARWCRRWSASSGCYQRLSAPAVTRARELRSEHQRADGRVDRRHGGAAGQRRRRGASPSASPRTNEAHYAARLAELRANAWLLRPALDLLNVVLLAS